MCLESLLAGKWLNQDEFARLGKGAKKAFLAQLTECSLPNAASKVLIIDRINTMKSHRKDIFEAMRTVGIRVGIHWDSTVHESVARVKQRHLGHRSILPGANVGLIVGRTANQFEPLSEEEINSYQIRKIITVDQLATREEVVRKILLELASMKELAGWSLSKISEADVASGLALSAKREKAIFDENKESIPVEATPLAPTREKKRWLRVPTIPHPPSLSVQKGRFEIHFTETDRFKRIFDTFGDGSTPLECKADFHVTLLYISASLLEFITYGKEYNRYSNHFSHDYKHGDCLEYRNAIEMYLQLRDTPIPVVLQYVAQSSRAMVVKCTFGQGNVHGLKFFDVIPHVSLAKIKAAQFRECNTLVADVERLREMGCRGQNIDGTISWVDLDDESPIFGKLRFVHHGDK